MMRDCICIFDDFENLVAGRLVWTLGMIKTLLEISRKKNVHIIIITHQTQNYKLTKNIIYECTTYVLFPWSNLNASGKFLESYGNVNKREIQGILDKTKNIYDFLLIYKAAPRYFMSRHNITLL